MSALPKQRTAGQALVLMALGAACLTLGDFVIKQALLTGTTLQQLFGIGPLIFQALLMLVAYLSKEGWRAHLPLRKPKLMLIRALVGLAFTTFAYLSLWLNPYTQHAMLLQTAPVITSILTLIFLGEAFSRRIIVVAMISLLGAGLIIGPGSQELSWWLLLPVLAATANAAANVIVARYRDVTTAMGFVFWSSWSTTILGFIWWLSDGAHMPSMLGLGLIILMAVSMAFSLVCIGTAMVWASRVGIASRVPLMMYVQTPVALFLGVFFLHESLSVYALIGAAMILLSGIWMVLAQRRAQ